MYVDPKKKGMIQKVKTFITAYFPIIRYYRAAKKLGDKARRRKELMRELIAESMGKECLQIGVRKAKLAPHWISVDLYDDSDYIDYNYDVQDLKFEDDKFDIVVCNAVLEHIEDPIKTIGELRRVLKKGGLIWVQVPFNQQYHGSPDDYWRVTPDGIRIWMKDFTEIESGFYRLRRSAIYTSVFFYGRK